MASSRLLSLDEMKRVSGKDGENPYLAGVQKWDPTYKGVDMFTGNYSMSATDLDFQGGSNSRLDEWLARRGGARRGGWEENDGFERYHDDFCL